MTGTAHAPVLLAEAVAALSVARGGLYVDGTFGRGGHSREILRHLPADGRLWAFDRDPAAALAAGQLAQNDPRLQFFDCNFAQLGEIARARGEVGHIEGLLLDLGVSSPQLDVPERGFSFSRDGPLDMRMDPRVGQSAREWIAEVDEVTLADTLYRYAQERQSRRIARRIVAARASEPIERTAQLAALVAAAVGGRRGRDKHPATRTFQAIRIAINGELEALSQLLAEAWALLAPGGRLAVISFHSMEDRLVKQLFRGPARTGPRRLPVAAAVAAPLWRGGGRVQRPSERECERNPRARSAVLRCGVKA